MTRGLVFPSISAKLEAFRLGYVEEPLPSHEMFEGMLAIPYLRYARGSWSVASIRFRCLKDHEHHGHGKYMTQSGDSPRLFNTGALLKQSSVVGIAEGEIDAITASICGLPTVGVPGANSWQPHFREPFLGYRTVYVLADGDEPGHKFAAGIAGELPNAKVVSFPPKEDTNSFVVKHGRQQFLERIKQ